MIFFSSNSPILSTFVRIPLRLFVSLSVALFITAWTVGSGESLPTTAHPRVSAAASGRAAPATRRAAAARPAPQIPENQWMQLTPHTSVNHPGGYIPQPPQNRLFRGRGYKLSLWARNFAQGNLVYFEITPEARPPVDLGRVKFFYKDILVPTTRLSWGLRGFFALAPDTQPGLKKIAVRTGSGPESDTVFFLQAGRTNYQTNRDVIQLGASSNQNPQQRAEILEFIRKCQEKKQRVFSIVGQDLFSNRLSHPRNKHGITSHFNVSRVLQTYRWERGRRVYLPPSTNIHGGLDLYGWTGEPIYAMADGRVVIAERMHFEGNFTVIDHGNGIFSGYMHQSRITAIQGSIVRAGDKIGECGATGMATGPHLHVSLWVRGVAVDPMSLLSLPVRN